MEENPEQTFDSLKKENEQLKKEIERMRVLRENQKQGMVKKAQKGELMSRAAFGYKIENKKLIPAQNFKEIEEIFEEFLNENISLRRLAEKHSLSVNGLKKILKNFTYLGKIKFNNQVFEATHQPLISSTLFNQSFSRLNIWS